MAPPSVLNESNVFARRSDPASKPTFLHRFQCLTYLFFLPSLPSILHLCISTTIISLTKIVTFHRIRIIFETGRVKLARFCRKEKKLNLEIRGRFEFGRGRKTQNKRNKLFTRQACPSPFSGSPANGTRSQYRVKRGGGDPGRATRGEGETSVARTS